MEQVILVDEQDSPCGVMEKMQAKSIAELVQMAIRLDLLAERLGETMSCGPVR